MITFDPGVGEPTNWILCFYPRAATSWMNWLPLIGRYKHVRAFGCVPVVNTWVFYDVALDRTAIRLARGDAARALMTEWLHDADAIGMPAASRERLIPRMGSWCVPAMKHLIGLRSGALRPDALWRDCVRQGGEIIEGAIPAAVRRSAGPAATAAGSPGGSR